MLDAFPAKMRGLYAIADVGTLAARGLSPAAFAESVLSAAPAALQVRAKGTPPREGLAILRAIAPMCHRVSVPLVVNDHPEWAIMAGGDMVHVGQRDMPVDRVRRLAPGVGVGVSTHTIAELKAALTLSPAYVAFGPVFETSTKLDPEPVVGVLALREAWKLALSAGVPLVAIGGITRERARSLVGLVSAVAVISDLLPPAGDGVASGDLLDEVAARARAFVALFASGPIEIEARR